MSKSTEKKTRGDHVSREAVSPWHPFLNKTTIKSLLSLKQFPFVVFGSHHLTLWLFYYFFSLWPFEFHGKHVLLLHFFLPELWASLELPATTCRMNWLMSFQYGRRRPHVCHLKRFRMFPSLSFFKGGHNLILFDFFECHDLRFSFHGANVEPRARAALVRCLAGFACACVCVIYIYSFFIFCLSHYPVFLFSDSTRTRAHTHTHKHSTYTYACTYIHT